MKQSKEAKFCRECGKKIVDNDSTSSLGFCCWVCYQSHNLKLQPKVYCNNCRHYKNKVNDFVCKLGITSMCLAFVLAILFEGHIGKPYLRFVFGVGALILILGIFMSEKYCSLKKKEYQKIDTPEQHTEELVTLTEYDLNKDNHCAYYEVKQ